MCWLFGCEGVFGGFCSGIAGKGCPSRLTHNIIVVHYNCGFIHGVGGEINVHKKWSSNDWWAWFS